MVGNLVASTAWAGPEFRPHVADMREMGCAATYFSTAQTVPWPADGERIDYEAAASWGEQSIRGGAASGVGASARAVRGVLPRDESGAEHAQVAHAQKISSERLVNIS